MVAGSSRAPGFTRRRGISRNNLPSHWVNLNAGTSLATSIAGWSANTCCRKRIQVLRMPVSPSGRRFRCGAADAAKVRNTVSASGNGMLPTKWTIGLGAVAALIAALPSTRSCDKCALVWFQRQPTRIAMDKQPDDEVMHLGRAGTADCLAPQACGPGAQRQVLPRNVLRVARVRFVLFRSERTRVRAP